MVVCFSRVHAGSTRRLRLSVQPFPAPELPSSVSQITMPSTGAIVGAGVAVFVLLLFVAILCRLLPCNGGGGVGTSSLPGGRFHTRTGASVAAAANNFLFISSAAAASSGFGAGGGAGGSSGVGNC
ncbi:hypothetical protein U9M48_014706 [Paspalum notatum var. saurae]|uniref:Uncharacterized protein n=1 Tax=Paspalum notatum var. saurae TaxID=547442 RepID=A0AAQ3T2E9_PASNO